VQIQIDAIIALQAMAKAGKVKPIMVTSPKRSPIAPVHAGGATSGGGATGSSGGRGGGGQFTITEAEARENPRAYQAVAEAQKREFTPTERALPR
jgi:hypothetical protein